MILPSLLKTFIRPMDLCCTGLRFREAVKVSSPSMTCGDYAIVLVNGKKAGVLDRRLKQNSLKVELPAGQATIDILVENLGRINFGPYLLKNKKGITDSVTLNAKKLTGWMMFSLPFDDPAKISFSGNLYQVMNGRL